MPELIAPVALKELVAANKIQHAVVIGEVEGFKVNVNHDTVERTVSARTVEGKNKVRVFRSLDAVARFLHHDVHITHYEVKVLSFPNEGSRPKRPDTSRRMQKAHELAAYNRAFIADVEESLADPRPNLSADDVEARFAARRATAAKKLTGDA